MPIHTTPEMCHSAGYHNGSSSTSSNTSFDTSPNASSLGTLSSNASDHPEAGSWTALKNNSVVLRQEPQSSVKYIKSQKEFDDSDGSCIEFLAINNTDITKETRKYKHRKHTTEGRELDCTSIPPTYHINCANGPSHYGIHDITHGCQDFVGLVTSMDNLCNGKLERGFMRMCFLKIHIDDFDLPQALAALGHASQSNQETFVLQHLDRALQFMQAQFSPVCAPPQHNQLRTRISNTMVSLLIARRHINHGDEQFQKSLKVALANYFHLRHYINSCKEDVCPLFLDAVDGIEAHLYDVFKCNKQLVVEHMKTVNPELYLHETAKTKCSEFLYNFFKSWAIESNPGWVTKFDNYERCASKRKKPFTFLRSNDLDRLAIHLVSPRALKLSGSNEFVEHMMDLFRSYNFLCQNSKQSTAIKDCAANQLYPVLHALAFSDKVDTCSILSSVLKQIKVLKTASEQIQPRGFYLFLSDRSASEVTTEFTHMLSALGQAIGQAIGQATEQKNEKSEASHDNNGTNNQRADGNGKEARVRDQDNKKTRSEQGLAVRNSAGLQTIKKGDVSDPRFKENTLQIIAEELGNQLTWDEAQNGLILDPQFLAEGMLAGSSVPTHALVSPPDDKTRSWESKHLFIPPGYLERPPSSTYKCLNNLADYKPHCRAFIKMVVRMSLESGAEKFSYMPGHIMTCFFQEHGSNIGLKNFISCDSISFWLENINNRESKGNLIAFFGVVLGMLSETNKFEEANSLSPLRKAISEAMYDILAAIHSRNESNSDNTYKEHRCEALRSCAELNARVIQSLADNIPIPLLITEVVQGLLDYMKDELGYEDDDLFKVSSENQEGSSSQRANNGDIKTTNIDWGSLAIKAIKTKRPLSVFLETMKTEGISDGSRKNRIKDTISNKGITSADQRPYIPMYKIYNFCILLQRSILNPNSTEFKTYAFRLLWTFSPLCRPEKDSTHYCKYEKRFISTLLKSFFSILSFAHDESIKPLLCALKSEVKVLHEHVKHWNNNYYTCKRASGKDASRHDFPPLYSVKNLKNMCAALIEAIDFEIKSLKNSEPCSLRESPVVTQVRGIPYTASTAHSPLLVLPSHRAFGQSLSTTNLPVATAVKTYVNVERIADVEDKDPRAVKHDNDHVIPAFNQTVVLAVEVPSDNDLVAEGWPSVVREAEQLHYNGSVEADIREIMAELKSLRLLLQRNK